VPVTPAVLLRFLVAGMAISGVCKHSQRIAELQRVSGMPPDFSSLSRPSCFSRTYLIGLY